MFLIVTLFLSLIFPEVFSYSEDPSKPNIVILLADDLGWNDVGYHGASNIETPNIDLLASEGLRLESHYVLPLCSPTRAALLTGRYPIRTGIQSAVFMGCHTYGLSIDQPLLSETLKNDFGYTTHMIGKWHLGYSAWQYTPTYRGFDTFFGFYLGEQDKYTHEYSKNGYNGIDLRNGIEKADMNIYNNYYSAWMEGNSTLNLLNNVVNKEISNDPFFMYLSYSTPHKPVEAPDFMIEKYKDSVDSSTRQEYSAMVDILDDVIGNVISEIKKLNMWDNTLIIFMSDNGGEKSIGDNFPLCGNKNMLWEGGTRSPTFVTGGYLTDAMKNKIITNEIMHVTDWYPTIISILNENYVNEQNAILSGKSSKLNDKYFGEIDGINQWPFLNNKNNDESLRNEFLYNIDPNLCVSSDSDSDKVCGAIRNGKYKYILANKNDVSSYNMIWQTGKPSVECGESAKTVVRTEIDSNRCQGNTVYDGCLFDLENDPCELFDISDENIDIANELFTKLSNYYNNEMNTQLEMLYEQDCESSDPSNEEKNGFWEPWIDLNDYNNKINPYLKLKTNLPSSNSLKSQKFSVNFNSIFNEFNGINALYIFGMAAIVLICASVVGCSIIRSRRQEKQREFEEFSPLLNMKKERVLL